MRKNLPRLYSGIPASLRGKSAAFSLLKPDVHYDVEKETEKVASTYEKYIRLNKLDRTLEYNFPQFYNRLSERRRPCEIRKQILEDKRRKKDRAEVRHLCEWFMWAKAAYKPPTKKSKK